MSFGVSRIMVAAACLVWLAGCESSGKNGALFGSAAPAGSSEPAQSEITASTAPAGSSGAVSAAKAPDALPEPRAVTEVTGATIAPLPRRAVIEPPPPGPWSPSADPLDGLSLGKRQFREGNYGLAEMHFRRVVEHDTIPAQRKAEAWVGLAASYDRLKRFDLADRAYASAIAILGPTPEILNNQGFSYMLRGDYSRARAKLTEALERDPTNPFIQNNIEILEKTIRGNGSRKKV
jgi:tetratricopeptide (TPR) repeat protein